MTELLLLAAVAFAAGFCTGWSLRAALARAVLRDMEMICEKAEQIESGEIVPLEWVHSDREEYYQKLTARHNRAVEEWNRKLGMGELS